MPATVATAWLWALAAVGAPQDMASLQSRLDPATYEALRPVLERAGRDSVPLRALEAKALEGTAKRKPFPQIVAAVGRLADELRSARGLLREAAPGSPLADGEILAAAEVLRRGVPPGEVAQLRRTARPAAVLEIPLAVLGELVARGVPADQARSVIEQLVASDLPQGRMVELPARVDIALRVGAPPGAALASALHGLGIPRPLVPPGRGRRPGRPNP